jgi:hypothetical protein
MPVRHSCREQHQLAFLEEVALESASIATLPPVIMANSTLDGRRKSQILTTNLPHHLMSRPLLSSSTLLLEGKIETNSAQLLLNQSRNAEATAERGQQHRVPSHANHCGIASTATSDSCTGERKRCSLSSLSEATTVALPNNPLFVVAELPLGAFSALPPHKDKKRRVTFCKTTKPPSIVTIQQPSLLMKNITLKSASCTSLPQLVPSSSCNSLLSESSTVDLDLSVSPATFLKTIILQSGSITGSMRGEDIISHISLAVNCDSYFLKYRDEHLEAYTSDKVSAVQGNDIEQLRTLLKSGHLMQASNRFGESMLHTSCRRGYTDMVEFFLHEAYVSPRVRDDMGRNPMHDACWSSASPNFDMMKLLIRAAPELLLSKDKRGHSPFDYARREYWPNWIAFLNENRQFIVTSLVSSCRETSEPLPADDVEASSDRLQFTGWGNFSNE